MSFLLAGLWGLTPGSSVPCSTGRPSVSELAGQGPWGPLAWAPRPCGPGARWPGRPVPVSSLAPSLGVPVSASGSSLQGPLRAGGRGWRAGQPRGLQPGPRCACLGPVSLWEEVWPPRGVRPEDPHTEVRAQSRGVGRVLGPQGASASSSGSVVPSRDSPGRTRGCPHGSPLSRGCPQPAALRSPGPGWAGHPSFTAQGARILQGDFYTEMPLEPVWGQNSDMSSI